MSVSFPEMEAFCQQQKEELEFHNFFESMKSILIDHYKSRNRLNGDVLHIPGKLYSCNMFILSLTRGNNNEAYIVLNYTLGLSLRLMPVLIKKETAIKALENLKSMFPN